MSKPNPLTLASKHHVVFLSCSRLEIPALGLLCDTSDMDLWSTALGQCAAAGRGGQGLVHSWNGMAVLGERLGKLQHLQTLC